MTRDYSISAQLNGEIASILVPSKVHTIAFTDIPESNASDFESVLVDRIHERPMRSWTYRCEALRFAASSDRLEYGLFRALLVLRVTEGILG